MIKKQKKIALTFIILVAFIFCFISYVFLPIFIFAFLFIVNTQTIHVNKEEIEIKNSIPILPKSKIPIKSIDHFEVKRVETTTKDNKTQRSFQLVAFFKNGKSKKIYSNMNMDLVYQMDKTIEKFLDITDITNDEQVEKLKVSNLEHVINEDIFNYSLKDIDTSKPSKEYPFYLKSNLIKYSLTYYSNFNQKFSGIFFILFGIVSTVFSMFLFSPVGVPMFIWGLSKLLNKQYLTVLSSKLTYDTKPISFKKERELLKSQIKSIEVINSNILTNGKPSFHLVATTKDGRKIKLIRHVFNVVALIDICNKITKRMNIVSN